MSWGRLTHMTAASGIAVLGLGVGLAVSACSPTTPGTAAPTAATKTAASSAAASTPAASVPATTPVASVSATGAAPTGAPTSTPTSAAPTTPVSSTANATPVDVNGKPFVVWDCSGKPQVEPATFVISCADDGTGWTAVHWTKWAAADATGVGIQYWKDCVPNCAEGKILDLPVDISLTGSYLAAQDEPFSYTKVTFTYTTSARPTVYVTVNGKVEATHPSTWTLGLPAVHVTGPSD